MSIIHDNVMLGHLPRYPAERELLIPFLANFDITYAHRKIFRGTELSIYFLSPDQTIQDQFGITSEILLAISTFATIQPRSMQAIEDVLQEPPARGRVDQTTYFLLTQKEVLSNKNDPWFLRACMSEQLFSRDLFNEQLPLTNDLFFFGRDQTVAEFLNAAKLSQNRGLFGLRKTGKTSVLFKLKRLAEAEGLLVLYYDCKDPSIRSLSWTALLERICSDIISERKGSIPKREVHISDQFKQVVRSATASRNICIIFDEIEYISPLAKLDPHWHKDFVPFWQTIWTTQSTTRTLSFVVSGVNPRVIEMDTVDEVQNPIFGIIAPKYLTGLSYPETRAMLHHFGKRMGLKFDFESCKYIFERFGGHPLLTRMAGSYINSTVGAAGSRRPFAVTRPQLESDQLEARAGIGILLSSYYIRIADFLSS